MNFSCSICLESFTPNDDISSTSCGHVFHTDCINQWMENGQNECAKCRRECRNDQIIKLYFSENDSAFEANQSQIETLEENLKLKQDNLKLTKKCQDLKSDFKNTEKNLNEKYQSVADEILKLREEYDDSSQKYVTITEENQLIKQTNKKLEKEVYDLKMAIDIKNHQDDDELDQLQAEFIAKIQKLKKRKMDPMEKSFEEIVEEEKGEVKQEQITPINPLMSPENVSKTVTKSTKKVDSVKRQLFSDEADSGNWVYSEKDNTWKLLRLAPKEKGPLNNEVDKTNHSNLAIKRPRSLPTPTETKISRPMKMKKVL